MPKTLARTDVHVTGRTIRTVLQEKSGGGYRVQMGIVGGEANMNAEQCEALAGTLLQSAKTMRTLEGDDEQEVEAQADVKP